MRKEYLDQRIRKVPNFPKEGILFYDITTLFEDAEAFKKVVDELADKYQGRQIDKIVGIDARGFILGAAMAYKLGCGLSVVRKQGKLPYKTKSAGYEKEYGPDIIEMHEDTIRPGEKVVIADDLLATGGTMLATVELVRQLKGEIIGIDFIINLSFLSGLEKLKQLGCPVNYLIEYDSETM
jgi:adenine phosphoribosyltransferase